MLSRRLLPLLFASFIFSGELEVEGNLTVTEGVSASSFAGDGSGLTNLPPLSGMIPQRIYSYSGIQYETKGLTVPTGKFWIVSSTYPTSSAFVSIRYDGEDKGILSAWESDKAASTSYVALENHSFQLYFGAKCIITILEYPISGSGTDQGMDYVEP